MYKIYANKNQVQRESKLAELLSGHGPHSQTHQIPSYTIECVELALIFTQRVPIDEK